MRIFLPLIFLVFFLSCNSKNDKTSDTRTISKIQKKNQKSNDPNKEENIHVNVDTLFVNDSVVITNQLYSNITVNINGEIRSLNYDEYKISTRDFFSPQWVNKDYAAFMVWWSQAQCRYIFVPVNSKNDFYYIDKDVDGLDSINNVILCVDSMIENSSIIRYNAINLKTKKSTKFDFDFRDYESYPILDNVSFQKDGVTLHLGKLSKTYKYSL